jgi:hypothetical protein
MPNKILVFLFLNLSFSQIVVPDTSVMSQTEKMLWYQNEKKSPSLGVLYSFLLPTAGHAYAGDWKRALLFKGSQIGMVFLHYSLYNKAWGERVENQHGKGRYPDYDASIEERAYYPLFAVVFILLPLEYYDVTKTVKKYNQQLYEKLFGK